MQNQKPNKKHKQKTVPKSDKIFAKKNTTKTPMKLYENWTHKRINKTVPKTEKTVPYGTVFKVENSYEI